MCRFIFIFLVVLGTANALAFGDAEPVKHPPVPWLHTRGTDIVDSGGKVILLRGFNLGGAMVMEPWMTAMVLNPGQSGQPRVRDEKTLWGLLESRFGAEKRAELQQVWRTAWANAQDIKLLADDGANVVRIPFWYEEVEDTEHPGKLLPAGAKLLDDLCDACAANGVYAIIDLHGAPGGQSDEQHTGYAGQNRLFSSPEMQERTARLWTTLAKHFRDRPEVAGYDLLNEPMGAANAAAVLALNDKLYRAIRAADERHIVFVEDGYKGNAAFPDKPAQHGWRNVVFSKHHYLRQAKGIEDHRKWISQDLARLRQQQLKWNVPIYIGEFSTITVKQGGVPALAEYFAAFNRVGWSWTPWSYKQISAGGSTHDMWGMVTNDKPWDRANPYTDSFDVLKEKFVKYSTSNLLAQPDYLEAFRAATKKGR